MAYRASRSFTWLLVGMGIGAGIALMYAPSKGREMRKFVSKRAGKARDFISDHGHDWYERGRDVVEEAGDLVERGRKLARM
jgi:gas vesicle protein